jgi:hypothetical protein
MRVDHDDVASADLVGLLRFVRPNRQEQGRLDSVRTVSADPFRQALAVRKLTAVIREDRRPVELVEHIDSTEASRSAHSIEEGMTPFILE